jgi:hypothetical protein
MAHIIMDHRVSWCFGTSLAPTFEMILEKYWIFTLRRVPVDLKKCMPANRKIKRILSFS